MASVSFEWGELSYEEVGAGEPLLLISGLNGLAQPWEAVAARLARRFRVITHDHRGLGRSSPWDGDYSVDQIAADALGLMDHLGLDKAHIVGHSLGGAVAQAIAADHPSRVDRLVIYASWPGPDPYFTRLMTSRREVLTAQGIEAFLRTGPLGIYPPRWIVEHDQALMTGLPSQIADFVGIPAMQRRIDACLAHDRRSSLARIGAPTLVLGLADDASTPPQCSEEIAAAIPGAICRLLPYGGHNAHVVIPHELTRELEEFLDD